MRSCIRRNCGIIRQITVPTPAMRIGMLTVRIHDSDPSTWMASAMPTMQVMGAATSSVQVISTNICTCVTSFVMRVISDGAPNWPTSRAENAVTWWNSASRTSRPNAMAALEPK